MHKIEMTDEKWTQLLALRERKAWSAIPVDDPVFSLYTPIATAKGRFVLAQVGQSLDGRVATVTGDARDISGSESINHLHRCRALVDAVVVGVGTVLSDDPQLSVREVSGVDPVRVVVDVKGELTGEEKLFKCGGAPVILFQNRDIAPRHYPGADVIRLTVRNDGLDPAEMLDALSERSLDRILVEGGARTISRFIVRDLVDHFHISLAPIIIGAGPGGISLPPIEKLHTARRPKAVTYVLGDDILFDCMMKLER